MWADSSCRWTRNRLPLMAGEDLVGLDRRRTQRHLITCAACRQRLDNLRTSLDVLHTVAAEAPSKVGAPSLWPEVARQIREQRHPAASASWGVSWSNAGFWSGAALAAGLVVVVGTLFRPAGHQVARVEPTPPPSPAALASAPPRPTLAPPADPAGPGALWTSPTDALAFAQEPPKKTHEPDQPPQRGDESTDRPRDGAPEVQPTR